LAVRVVPDELVPLLVPVLEPAVDLVPPDELGSLVARGVDEPVLVVPRV